MNEKKLFAYWYKLNGEHNNFGDELNPYIISKLSGKSLHRVPITGSRLRRLIKGLYYYLRGFITVNDLKLVFTSFHAKKIIVAIGSVLGWASGKDTLIWGSGIIDRKSHLKQSQFLAVRGKYTLKRIEDLGLNYNNVKYGDPAILLPLIFKKESVKKFRIGIIPHYIHFEEVLQIVQDRGLGSEVLVINLLDKVENVLRRILQCEKVVSTSLHGLIVPHAYKIPALWIKLSQKELAGDNIKFYDYFSSVEIQEYERIDLTGKNAEFSLKLIGRLFIEYDEFSTPKEISKVQSNLLKCAPFKLKPEYEVYFL